MEWTNDTVLNLIDLYRDRPVLWDCRLKEYKDRNKRLNALLDISNSFGVEKEEIERKLKNLVCHFSREIKKEREGYKSVAGSDDVYKSKWFCYDSMLFLKDRNRLRGMTDTQDQETSDDVEVTQEETQNIDQISEHSDSDETSESGKKRSTKSLFKSPPKKRKSDTEETLSVIGDVQGRIALRDQYTVFGEEIGMRIRDLSSVHAKKIAKHLISNILFEAEMGKYDHSITTTSSQPFYHLSHFTQPPSKIKKK